MKLFISIFTMTLDRAQYKKRTLEWQISNIVDKTKAIDIFMAC